MIRSKALRYASLAVVSLLVLLASGVYSVSIRWQFVGAAHRGELSTVRTMLASGMAPDTVSHIGGIRAISMAAYSGHIDVVRLLLDRGANPTYGLPQAILMKRTEIVRLLLAHHADVRHWPDYSISPLQFAQENSSKEIVSLLKETGTK